MFGKNWKLSERKYKVITKRDIVIPLDNGTKIDSDQYRPDTQEKVPAILGVHPYRKKVFLYSTGTEGGVPDLFCRRGYAQILINVRGTGKSDGKFMHLGLQEVKDTYEIIEWIADQPWCDGNVAMFGMSYFAIAQLQVATLNPPHLKAIVPISSWTDFYRMMYYHGGILNHYFLRSWSDSIFWDSPGKGFISWSYEKMGEKKYKEAIAQALQDPEICQAPYLVDALKNPDQRGSPFLIDLILNPFDTEYYQERSPKLNNITVPALLVGNWSEWAMHLPGSFDSWEKIKGPKKLIIGPPKHLAGPPINQLQYEAIRWYDYHIKGIDNGIMNEPPIKLFIPGTNNWKTAKEWPLPETIWTPFYLHPKGLLSEMEPWVEGGSSIFEDLGAPESVSPENGLKFFSPPLVEDTEVIGSSVLHLYASASSSEVLWFIGLLDVDAEGKEKLIAEGWLRGSQREVDPERSKPWSPFHPHRKREPLVPNEIYHFTIEIVPTANLFKAGHRIGLRIGCKDPYYPSEAGGGFWHGKPLDPFGFPIMLGRPQTDGLWTTPRTTLESIYLGHFWSSHLWNPVPKVVTVYHNAEKATHMFLPITKGNVMGTYVNYSRHLRNPP